LKREIDRRPGTFRFFLSGSQHFSLMRHVTESLVGRVAVLDLWPFAVQEIKSRDCRSATQTIELLENPERLEALIGREYPCSDRDEVVPAMLAGGYPPVALWGGGDTWLESYRRTYIQRDIRELSQVGDLGLFDRFVMLCAGRSGTVINKAELGRTLGVTHKTADQWLSLLETSYQIVKVPPQLANTTKRLVRRPKWIFADSGFGLHLQGIRDGTGLINAPHFGHLFESFVIMEIRKLYGHLGQPWNARFWRTPRGLECDLVLPSGGRLVPLEIKHTAAPGRGDVSPVRTFLSRESEAATTGIVVSMAPRVERLASNVFNLPLGILLSGPGLD
jgi:predicted AAA+ superfamily ATPase